MSKRVKSLPAPAPAPAATPEDVAAGSFRLAVRHYHEAEARHEHVNRLRSAAYRAAPVCEPDAEARRLHELAVGTEEALSNAGESLCHAVQLLAPGESLNRLNRLGQDWVPRGAVYRGRLYTSTIGDIEDCGRALLLVFDMKDVRGVGD